MTTEKIDNNSKQNKKKIFLKHYVRDNANMQQLWWRLSHTKKNISKKAPNIIAHALFEQKKKGKRPSEKFK